MFSSIITAGKKCRSVYMVVHGISHDYYSQVTRTHLDEEYITWPQLVREVWRSYYLAVPLPAMGDMSHLCSPWRSRNTYSAWPHTNPQQTCSTKLDDHLTSLHTSHKIFTSNITAYSPDDGSYSWRNAYIFKYGISRCATSFANSKDYIETNKSHG